MINLLTDVGGQGLVDQARMFPYSEAQKGVQTLLPLLVRFLARDLVITFAFYIVSFKTTRVDLNHRGPQT